MRFSLPPPVLSLLSKNAPPGALWDMFHNICAMLTSDGNCDHKTWSAKTDRGLNRGLVLLVVKYVIEAKKKKKKHDGNKVPGRQMTERLKGFQAWVFLPHTCTHTHTEGTHTEQHQFPDTRVWLLLCDLSNLLLLLAFWVTQKPEYHLSICVTAQVVATRLWLSPP